MGNNENSGIINFGIKEYMNEQFNKVKKSEKRDYLTISEVFLYSFSYLKFNLMKTILLTSGI